ncbi:MAG: GntR family transcriptional regulator [Clostridia bacterium]|nr:GntR family transcriptional regulator [Clostridia bacterium]
MISKKAFSLADQIYEQLETEILSGAIPRGEIITETKIATRLGVSRTPVRDALLKLEADHMVENTPKGLQVVGITDQDASIIYTIREKIESMAVGLAAQNATEEQIAEMKEILDLQYYYFEKENAEKIREQDSAFHEALYASTGYPVLKDTLKDLHRKIQKYRKLAVSSHNRAEDSVNEHREILDAIIARDVARAEAAGLNHIKMARERIAERHI